MENFQLNLVEIYVANFQLNIVESYAGNFQLIFSWQLRC